MSLVVWSAKRNRAYVRRFDHDEARERFAAGEAIVDLARAYGVQNGAVRRVCDPAYEARRIANVELSEHTVCEVCGGRCLRADHPARRTEKRAVCHLCVGKESRENVRFSSDGSVDEVKCETCKWWKDPVAFGRGRRYKDLREGGFHGSCRSCQTQLKRSYREARKVPCSHGCETLVEGVGRRNPEKPPECRPCSHARIKRDRLEAATEEARTRQPVEETTRSVV